MQKLKLKSHSEIIDQIPEIVKKTLRYTGGVLAGGSLNCLALGIEVRDWDLWITDTDLAYNFLLSKKATEIKAEKSSSLCKSFSTKDSETLQIIKNDTYNNILEFIEDFDLECCKGFYVDGACSIGNYEKIEKKLTRIRNPSKKLPSRIAKYSSRGYRFYEKDYEKFVSREGRDILDYFKDFFIEEEEKATPTQSSDLKNNQGRKNCFLCKAETKEVFGFLNGSVYNICPSCKI